MSESKTSARQCPCIFPSKASRARLDAIYRELIACERVLVAP